MESPNSTVNNQPNRDARNLKIFIFSLLVVCCAAAVYFLNQNAVKQEKQRQWAENIKCRYEISEIKVSSGYYGDPKSTYLRHEGKIRNASNRTVQLLKMEGRIYTDDRTLVNYGHTEYSQTLEPGTAILFRVDFPRPTEEQKGMTPEIRPLFSGCISS